MSVVALPLPIRARRRILPLLGPAFVTAVAYVDPGNFATNITAGSAYGYLLVWVVVVSNLMAMVIQYLSAKVGIATGMSLAELCREHYPRPVSRGLWVQAEVVAMATDLAEVVGGAIALRLLFDLPLLVGGVITAGVAFGLLGVRRRGHRQFEAVVVGLLVVIGAGFLTAVALAGLDLSAIAGGVVPRLDGTDSLLLAVAMLGATVMPHAIYLHSGLTSDRRSADGPIVGPGVLLRGQRVDVVTAMSLAGVMNLLLLVIAAAALAGHGVDSIEGAHAGLGETLGPVAAAGFAIALLASGFAASSVGTLSGELIMAGFTSRRIPLLLRRLVTLAPALLILAVGVDPTSALIWSQVALSFGIPFALGPLVHLTARRSVMGEFVNARVTTWVGSIAVAVVVALNVTLIALTL